MFEQLEEQQKAVQEKLAAQTIEVGSGDGLVVVRMTGNKVVRSVIIDRDHADFADPDAVEDHLVMAMNEAIRKATEMEQQVVQEWMASVLPGGMGALGGLFGR